MEVISENLSDRWNKNCQGAPLRLGIQAKTPAIRAIRFIRGCTLALLRGIARQLPLNTRASASHEILHFSQRRH